MFKSLKQLFQEAQNLNLSKDEKSLIRHELQMHVRNDLALRQHMYRSKLKTLKLTFIKPMPIFIVILLALGGTSFAAEKTLPGDVLYPVKLSVNEHVQGWLSVSDEAKANWETVLANRRLSEAENLAVKSKLDAETEAQIQTNFENHTKKVQERIAKLANIDAKVAADIAANLQTSLEAHNRILLNIRKSKDGDDKSNSTLVLKIRSETKDTSDDRVKSEDKVKSGPDVQTAAEGRLKSAENKLREVQKFIENKKADISAETLVQIQAQLKVATDLIVQGKAKLEAKAYGEAFILFGQAKNKAQEIKLLLEAKTHLEDKEDSDDEDSDLDKKSSSSEGFRDNRKSLNKEEGNRGSGKIKIDISL